MAQRIGLLTLPLRANYGGILQALALHEYLRSIGKEVILLDRNIVLPPRQRIALKALRQLPFLKQLAGALAPPLGHGPSGAGRGVLARRLSYLVNTALEQEATEVNRPVVDAFLPQVTRPLLSTEDMAEAVSTWNLDGVVVGSDQVWRLDYLPPGGVVDYFLGFAGPSVRKVSYAASFGHGTWAYPEETERVRGLLARFDAVSVRETSGVAICETSLGRPGAAHTIDPTLLVDPSFYDRVALPPEGRSGKTLLGYVLDQGPGRAAIAGEIAKALGSDYRTRLLTLEDGARSATIAGWVRAFMDADFVVTDSFHGTVFSIIFGKNFVAIANPNRGLDRFVSLLGQLGLRDRLMTEPSPEQARELARTPIDFGPVRERLSELRQSSARFLEEALR